MHADRWCAASLCVVLARETVCLRYTAIVVRCGRCAGFLKCEATVSDVNAVFATEVHVFTNTDSGEIVLGFSGSATLPADLSGVVYHVAGLSNFKRPRRLGRADPINQSINSKSSLRGSVPANATYTTIPDWLRKQYNSRVRVILILRLRLAVRLLVTGRGRRPSNHSSGIRVPGLFRFSALGHW